MAQRVSLGSDVELFTPGYSWQLDLDLFFDGERPEDWADWRVRMHVWSTSGFALSLGYGTGVSVEPVENLEGADGPVSIPVIRLTREQTESMRSHPTCFYLIDVAAPDDDPEDYFSGKLLQLPSPPRGVVP